tara:strand:- start:441 stop:620 length:180 start_codon:yes stop_codon:yes gene_type:complete
MLEVVNTSYLSLEAKPQPMMYAREPDVITVELKVTTHIRLYWGGNSGVALDGAGVRPPS